MTTLIHTDPHQRAVRIPAAEIVLDGNMAIPPTARGVVLFAHGSGSSRHSPRNRFVAAELQRRSLATLLIDLLTPDEESIDAVTAELRFNVPLLAQRLLHAAAWLGKYVETKDLPLGYFGASTGGGAALVAAADRPNHVAAVVSRGGRPDLAGDALPRVKAPTLLLVGGEDHQVIELNEQAMQAMRCPKQLTLIPHATHLFEEPGTLQQVAVRAADWFERYMPRRQG
jgi:dienelactone hydrolase